MAKKEGLSEEILNLIKGFTIENIEKYKKANQKAILGKILGSNPSTKSKIPEISKEIATTIKEFESLSNSEFNKFHKKYTAHLIKPPKRKGRKGLPELKKTNKEYAFRFAPAPSGPLHIGNSIQLLLNTEYAKKYKGKFVLRIEDTNPSNIYLESYKLIPKDVKWLSKNYPTQIITQSKKIEDYYNHAKELLTQNKAYVCTCQQEAWRNFVSKKEACPCRNLSVPENKKRWENMFKEYQEGEAVLRIKTDMKHKNPAVRDWPAFRISDEKHPLQGKKYRVWPLMNFSVSVDDHDSNLTHIIRGKDHIVNMERQSYIYKYFNWEIPEYMHTGRINFEGLELSKSKFKEDIQKGKYDGWDDSKLPTISAFKRRGIQPEAFIKYVQELGPSKVDKVVRYKEFMNTIYSFNKKIIEPKANRYFIIEDPIKIELKKLPKSLKAELPLHPEHPKRGKRKFPHSTEFYIEKKDKPEKDKNYRFMHLCNFSGKNNTYISKENNPSLKTKALHYLPITPKYKPIKILVKMAHGKPIKAIGEPTLKTLKEGTIVQFERKFFARFDKKEKDTYIFYFTHR